MVEDLVSLGIHVQENGLVFSRCLSGVTYLRHCVGHGTLVFDGCHLVRWRERELLGEELSVRFDRRCVESLYGGIVRDRFSLLEVLDDVPEVFFLVFNLHCFILVDLVAEAFELRG